MNTLRFIKHLHQTQDEEILCSDCLREVNQYVDLELNGQPAERLMPHLKHHLDLCLVCREEYSILRDLSRAGEDGASLSIEELWRELRE